MQRTQPTVTTIHLVIASLFIFVATMMTFVNSVNADFVNWDDTEYVTENPLVQSLSFESVAHMFTQSHYYAWIPLTLLSHAIDIAAWGMNAKGHHLTNVLLHSSNAVLFFFACIVMFKSLSKERNAAAGLIAQTTTSMLIGGLIASLLFAMHPLRVESVAWISGRKDLLCAFFLLVSFIAYLFWKFNARRLSLILSIVSFACALMSKPMAAPFPIVLLLWDAWMLRKKEKVFLAEVLKDKIALLLLSTIALLLAMAAAPVGRINVLAELSLFERALLSFYMIFFYLWKLLVPVGLSPIYPELERWLLYSSPILFVGAVGGIFFLMKRQANATPLAFVAFILLLTPVFFGVSSGLQPLADRYSYLATMSVFMLIGGGVELLWRTSAESGAKKFRRRVFFAALLVLCAVSSYRTLRHTGVWENSVELWTQAVRYVPLTREEYEARKPYMKPTHLDALINLGTAYYSASDTTKAFEQFRKVLLLDSANADAHYNLGTIHFERGAIGLSKEMFRNAIRFDSTYVKAHYNLGVILARDSVEQAVAAFQAAARFGDADAQQLLRKQGIGW